MANLEAGWNRRLVTQLRWEVHLPDFFASNKIACGVKFAETWRSWRFKTDSLAERRRAATRYSNHPAPAACCAARPRAAADRQSRTPANSRRNGWRTIDEERLN
jgi:hypothetical protein